MKNDTPAVIIFDTKITTVNHGRLNWWVDWVGKKIFWKGQAYIDGYGQAPLISTTDVQIRIACSMAEKLELNKKELSELLNNLSNRYAKLCRDINARLQEELPF